MMEGIEMPDTDTDEKAMQISVPKTPIPMRFLEVMHQNPPRTQAMLDHANQYARKDPSLHAVLMN